MAQHIVNQKKDVITVAAARNTHAPTNTTRTPGESAEPEATNAVGMLDLVLPDATLGTLRRFWPDSSLVRYATRLASRPGTVARRAAKLTAELAGIAKGSSAIAPAPPRPSVRRPRVE